MIRQYLCVISISACRTCFCCVLHYPKHVKQAQPAKSSSSSNIGAFDGSCMCVYHTRILRYYQLFFLRLVLDLC